MELSEVFAIYGRHFSFLPIFSEENELASLMENLIDVLNRQYEEYEELLKLSEAKTDIIIKGDVPALSEMTEKEQEAVERVNLYDKKREEIMKDIANVINKDYNTLKLTNLIEMLPQRPEEQQKLTEVRDKLKDIALAMKKVNERNGILLKNSLEMVEFDLNLIREMRKAPETANYDRGAANTGDILGTGSGLFDCKQ